VAAASLYVNSLESKLEQRLRPEWIRRTLDWKQGQLIAADALGSFPGNVTVPVQMPTMTPIDFFGASSISSAMLLFDWLCETQMRAGHDPSMLVIKTRSANKIFASLLAQSR